MRSIASVNRGPLAMGLLTGKRYARPEAGDIRSQPPSWLPGFGDGRTPAQGALAWIWARSPHTIPIPGFRSVAQAEENAGAMEKGPLTAVQSTEIDRVLNGEQPHPQGARGTARPAPTQPRTSD